MELTRALRSAPAAPPTPPRAAVSVDKATADLVAVADARAAAAEAARRDAEAALSAARKAVAERDDEIARLGACLLEKARGPAESPRPSPFFCGAPSLHAPSLQPRRRHLT